MKSSGKALLFVVDDEPLLIELAAAILEPAGYAVKTFLDPELALDAYRSAKPAPDLVITDYAMHRMNGLDLLRECRRIRSGQKFLLVSGTVEAEVYRNSRTKPDRFLAKPYQAKQLLDAVELLLVG